MTFTIDAVSHISPNHSSRSKPTPSALVLHSSEGTRVSDLPWLKKVQGEKSVSCHYYVQRDGVIYQMVPDWREAWHAGISDYLGLTGWGDFSLGIEFEHKQGQNWPEIQRQAGAWLCKLLVQKYLIAKAMVVAHRWIAPTRKVDPTDWDDRGLMAWIDQLYVVDWLTLWGPQIMYHEQWGIAQAWRDSHRNGKPLGHAITDELSVEGWTAQCFDAGFILWDAVKGTKVGWWN